MASLRATLVGLTADNHLVRIDAESRRVIVGPREALKTQGITLRDVNWIGDGTLQVIEYSDLPDELAKQTNADGSPVFNAGSIAIHAIQGSGSTSGYEGQLVSTTGIVTAVRSRVFKAAPYPNWTAVGVNWLAGFDFEIKVVARIPSTN